MAAAPDETDRLRLACQAVAGGAFIGGNSVRVLRNGDEIFPAMIDAIRSASRLVEFQTYIYWSGRIAREFAVALADRARAGVTVRVLLDALGSAEMSPDLIELMDTAGCEVLWFRPLLRLKPWENAHRSHRKILLVDDRVAFTGGVGIAKEWEGNARNPSEWRDTQIQISGPAVPALRSVFLADWRDAAHRLPDDLVDCIRASGTAEVGEASLLVVDGSAQIELNTAGRVIEALIAHSQRRVLIETPYFNPVPRHLELLAEAAQRGVAVCILVPGPHIDKRVSRAIARDQLPALVDAGARVSEYQPTMLHAKVVVIDDLAVVGSVNMNRRSAEKDEEVAVVVDHASTVDLLVAHFEDDLAAGSPFSPGDDPSSRVDTVLQAITKPIREMF